MDIFELKYRGSSFVVVFCCASRACNLWGLEIHFFSPENAFLFLQNCMRVLNSSSTLLFSLLLRRQEQRMKCVRWVRVHTVKRVYRGTVQSQWEENWLHRDILFFFLLLHMWHSIDAWKKKRRTTKARETDAGLRETRDIKKGTSRFQSPRQGCARGKWQNERKTVRVSYVFAENVQVWYFSQLPSFSPKRYPSKFKAKRSH